MLDSVRTAHTRRECDGAIRKIAQGDNTGLDTIYRLMGRMILSVALQITENQSDSEDVLQDVMLRLTGAADSYEQGTNAVAWILTITRNLSLNKVKSRKHTQSIDTLSELSTSTDEIERINESMTLADALSKLSAEDQLIVRLKNEVCLTHKEIALMLELTESCVEKRYERALVKLREYLTGGKGK